MILIAAFLFWSLNAYVLQDIGWANPWDWPMVGYFLMLWFWFLFSLLFGVIGYLAPRFFAVAYLALSLFCIGATVF